MSENIEESNLDTQKNFKINTMPVKSSIKYTKNI